MRVDRLNHEVKLDGRDQNRLLCLVGIKVRCVPLLYRPKFHFDPFDGDGNNHQIGYRLERNFAF